MPSKFLIPSVFAGLLVFGLVVAVEPATCLAQAAEKKPTDETDDPTNPLIPEFRRCDTDKDGLLTEAEYHRRIGFSMQDSHREFVVFDADGDARISLNEFLTVPIGQPDEHRGTITDPVIVLSKAKLTDLVGSWKQWDQNTDGLISGPEFSMAKLASRVKGLEATQFADWDLNRDGKVSRDEVARVLDVAYGVCAPDGTMLRSRAGRVVDWNTYLGLKKDANGIVTRNDYFQALGPGVTNPDEWFRGNDKNNDGRFDFVEFSTGTHRTDPVGTFLNMDVDLSGTVSRTELKTLPAGWRQMALIALRAFDDNADGELSLREYQLMPHSNLVAAWTSANDTDNDGMLSVDEFQFQKGVPLAAITREYFRRLDLNANQHLTLDEWLFQTKRPDVSDVWEICVTFADDTRKMIDIPGYAIVCSPEISPDAKWIAVDAWKSGQSNVTAHIFTVHVDTKEVRDLGIGCIPNWSADGRKIALSRYGKGVFIRDFEGTPVREESIDPQGWAIMFSPDGLKTAYVKRRNLVVHTVKTGEKKFVFPDGQSPYTYIEHNFTWSPDSDRLCFKGHRGNGVIDIGIVSASGDEPKLRIRCDGKNVQSDFAWLSDGKRLMFPYLPTGGEFTQTHSLDPEGDDFPVRYPRQPEGKHTGGLCWSRDGKTFVLMCRR
ncbi:MAG: EF-hand domain-containing protein [Planctomycetota bacterium]